MSAPHRLAATALLEEIRACVPDHGAVSVCTELRGACIRVRVRSPGHVGLTDDALRLLRDNDAAAGSLLEPNRPTEGRQPLPVGGPEGTAAATSIERSTNS
ncbi:MAG: hypothetical protein QOE59_2603 [Actinomycetota bacterium]|jgi:hypothetical protein|nr:hypothetical protein [Actinomycetota bacterium]